MKKTILIIEDDQAIRRGLVDSLKFKEFETLETGSGNEGLDLALKFNYDMLLLDLNLPDKDGIEILKEVRVSRPLVPIILLTARGSEMDRVRGLNAGADDYVVKPFSIRELIARIEAVIRRSPERPKDVLHLKLNDATVDFNKCCVDFSDGRKQDLTERELELLRYLSKSQGRPVSRDELLTHVWRISSGVETRTVDMHIARLRDKLRMNDLSPDIIVTVRGQGYMLAEHVQTEEAK
ncbi:MAG: response regulator transcription factor [Lentisphaeria bacterium]|nr:response regulator transcription factor [Lentisphaeria bacterium]